MSCSEPSAPQGGNSPVVQRASRRLEIERPRGSASERASHAPSSRGDSARRGEDTMVHHQGSSRRASVEATLLWRAREAPSHAVCCCELPGLSGVGEREVPATAPRVTCGFELARRGLDRARRVPAINNSGASPLSLLKPSSNIRRTNRSRGTEKLMARDRGGNQRPDYSGGWAPGRLDLKTSDRDTMVCRLFLMWHYHRHTSRHSPVDGFRRTPHVTPVKDDHESSIPAAGSPGVIAFTQAGASARRGGLSATGAGAAGAGRAWPSGGARLE